MWSGSCLPETWSSFAWITLRSCTLIPAWNEAVFFPLLNLVVGITGHPFQIFSSVTQSCLTLKPHGLQHTRLPCPSPTPGAYSNSCPSHLEMPSNHLIICRPLLLPPSNFPSIMVFSKESVLCIRWPKYWSFSFSISPSS